MTLEVIDLFAGIGGIRLGFESHGCKCIFSSENDLDAQKMYLANFGEVPSGDITKISPADIPNHDILLAGFPCQPFSILGKSLGFTDTRGTLFFNIEEILRVKQPYSFMLENVKQLLSHDNGKTLLVIKEKLEALGYYIHIHYLNALDFGLPQKRERVIIVGFKEDIDFKFPAPLGYYKPLSQILESEYEVDSSYFASEKIISNRLDKIKKLCTDLSIWHENKGGNISALPYSCALRAGASYNYLLVNGKRRLTSREMLRLQGFPEDFKVVVGYQSMRKLTGNSVAIPVIEAVAEQMVLSISLHRLKQTSFNKRFITPMQNILSPELAKAKSSLDKIIRGSRVHLYKPIQIAEVLYRHRHYKDIDINKIETYQNPSKIWRDSVTRLLVGNECTSSDSFQKALFDKQMPSEVLKILANENNSKDGIVEAYIYRQLFKKLSQLDRALSYCEEHDISSFNIKELIDLFEKEPGLRRSIDKIYEIIVYALFSVLAKATELSINLTFKEEKIDLLTEFGEFTKMIIGFELGKDNSNIPIRLYRAGVANASDRGLDIYANFGMIIQIKHISLSEEQAQRIVGAITADRIVIVCKKCDKGIITSLLGQLGWSSRIQSIVTEDHLIEWYNKALKGLFSDDIGNDILIALKEEIVSEFPAAGNDVSIKFNEDRGYTSLRDTLWIDLIESGKVK